MIRMVDARGALPADLGTHGFPSGTSALEILRQNSKGLRWVVVEAQGTRQVVFLGL